MKELKFTCPSCGQHIQCDWKHAGENVPCPGCAALIRVPLEGDLGDATVPAPATEDEKKVSYTAAPATEMEPKKSPSLAPSVPSASAPPATPAPAPPAAGKAPPATVSAAELHCVCPVCQSELRISVEPEPHSAPATTEPPLPGAGALTQGERERQIAAARARVRALHGASEKPRLDRILDNETVKPFAPLEDK